MKLAAIIALLTLTACNHTGFTYEEPGGGPANRTVFESVRDFLKGN